MAETKCAVILVAGEGKRLRPFTENNPKCFAEVSNRRILDNALHALSQHGCEKVWLVAGHLAERIQDAIKSPYDGMQINFVNNFSYQSTNSMYSLWLGLEQLDEPAWVVEGDIFMDGAIFGLPVSSEISWFVDSSSRECDGAYVETDAYGRARSLEIIRDLRLLRPNQYKSVGILNLSKTGVDKLRSWLGHGVKEGRENDYYDLILGGQLADNQVQVVDVAGFKWFEIDTPTELEKAREMFS